MIIAAQALTTYPLPRSCMWACGTATPLPTNATCMITISGATDGIPVGIMDFYIDESAATQAPENGETVEDRGDQAAPAP